MARLHRRENKEQLPGGDYSISCWFERARRMNSADAMVPLIHGIHLYHLKQYDAAEREMLQAERLAPESAEVHYNLGLLYVRLGNYPAAQQHADKAYAQGFPLPGLREQLARRR
jgi:Flp pilus assembly protein TadD